jgi:outer membrane protein assembly factor BamB
MIRQAILAMLFLIAVSGQAAGQFAPISGYRQADSLPELAEGHYYHFEQDGSVLVLDMRNFTLIRIRPDHTVQQIADAITTAARKKYPEGVALQWKEDSSEMLAVSGAWLCILDADNLPVLVPIADPARYVPLQTELRGLTYGAYHGMAVWQQAAFAGETLVVAGEGNLLQAFNTAGEPSWQFMAGDKPRLFRPPDSDGVLLFSGADCLCLLDESGKCRWARYGLNVAVSDGQTMVIGLSHGGEIICIDLQGEERWRYRTQGLLLPAGIADGRLVIYGNRNQLICLDANGREVWQCHVPVGDLGFIRVTVGAAGEIVINSLVQDPFTDPSLLMGRFYVAISEIEYHLDANGLLQTGSSSDSEMADFPLEVIYNQH